MLSIEEIKSFIERDASSTKKQLAKTGLRYYEGNHDINDYRIFYIDADGNPKEDQTKSNIKISHPFSGCWWISKHSICFPVTAAL